MVLSVMRGRGDALLRQRACSSGHDVHALCRRAIVQLPSLLVMMCALAVSAGALRRSDGCCLQQQCMISFDYGRFGGIWMQSPQRDVVFEGKSWVCLFECTQSDIKVQATDFDTAFAESTIPIKDILQQVREGGRKMIWESLQPKFVESFETCPHFEMQRVSPQTLILAFRIHLAMSDNPPVSIELNIQDPASARDSMLKLTWAFVAFRRQARIESKKKIGDHFGTQHPSGSAVSGAALTGGAGPAAVSPLARARAKKPRKPEVFGAQPDSP